MSLIPLALADMVGIIGLRIRQKNLKKKIKDLKDFYKWSRQARERLNGRFPTEFRDKLRKDGIHLEGNIRRKIRSIVTATVSIKQ